MQLAPHAWFFSPSSCDPDPKQADRLWRERWGWAMGQGTYANARWGQASGPDPRGQKPSDPRALAPTRWNPPFTEREGPVGGHSPLRWATYPLVCAPMPGSSAPLCATISHPEATPTALQLHRGRLDVLGRLM